MKAAELFVRCLEKEGVTHAYGVPGEENADLMLALEDSSIIFTLTRHEQAAAFMAAVHGRLTGMPALCLATLGPGATNLMTGVADANMDRAPMIVVTGQGSINRLHKESHQIIDVVHMYEPVTKWAVTVHEAASIPELVRKGFRLARQEKPGAVLLELPEDVAGEQTDAEPIPPWQMRRPAPDDKIIGRAVDRLKQARRPLIIAGNGAIRRRASRQLRRFCEATRIGVMSTFMGKGAVDWTSETCLFTIGLGPGDLASAAVEESDLVITLGYDMVEYPPRLWNPDCRTDILHFDFEPAEVDRNYHPTVEVVGDIGHALWMMNQRTNEIGAGRFELDYQHRIRNLMIDDMNAHKDDDTKGSIRPQKAVWDLRDALKAEDILLSGVGAHKMWIARYYHCYEPNTCLIPNGFCAMGMPLPGAIAAAQVVDGRKIVGVAGDGDFLMNVQEMETARRLNSDITMVVWEDHAYGLISWKQEREFGRHTDVSFGNPDWEQLAAAFGWQGRFVRDAADFRPALDEALAHKGPTLIALPIDYRENDSLDKQVGGADMPI